MSPVSVLEICKILSVISFYSFGISIFLGINLYFTIIGIVLSLPYCIYLLIRKCFYVNKTFFFLFFFLVIGAFLNIFITNNGFGGVLVIIGVLCLSKFLVENMSLMYRHVYFFLLFFITSCFYKILILGIDPNNFYEDMSRNYLGLILILLNVLLLFSGFVTSNNVPVFITLSSLVLSVFLVGRSTIGAMVCLSILHLFYVLKDKSRWYIFSLIILFAVCLVYYWPDLIVLYQTSSFGGFGLDTPRYEIWDKFMRATNLFTHVLGIDVFTIPIVAEYNGNLHNEFLNLLARTGIGFWAFVCVFIYSICLYCKRQQFYVIAMLSIVVFRAFFDTGIFINNLGFTIYTIILYPFFIKSHENSSVNVHNETGKYCRFEITR